MRSASGGALMSAVKSIVPPPPNSNEKPFEIKDEISVFDGAMVYSGRHPHPQFLKDGSVRDHLEFLGASVPQIPRSKKRVRARQSWDILHEIILRIERNQIRPVRRAFDERGQLDPIRTIIPTSCLADLAIERGDRPKGLRHLCSETKSKTPMLLRKQAQRQQPARERAKLAIASLYPKGVPDQITKPNTILCRELARWLKVNRLPDLSNNTILRAAGRK
jgi:hypothetical protein